MAKDKNFLGVESFKIGAPGDGVMGTNLKNFPDVEVASVVLEGTQQNEETIPTESDETYLTVNSDSTPGTVTARFYGVEPVDMVTLMGGEVDPDGLWGAPSTPPNIYLSVEIKGKEISGKRGVMKIPYAKTAARIQGTITKNGLPAVEVVFTPNTPVSEAGVKGSPFKYGTEDVPVTT